MIYGAKESLVKRQDANDYLSTPTRNLIAKIRLHNIDDFKEAIAAMADRTMPHRQIGNIRYVIMSSNWGLLLDHNIEAETHRPIAEWSKFVSYGPDVQMSVPCFTKQEGSKIILDWAKVAADVLASPTATEDEKNDVGFGQLRLAEVNADMIDGDNLGRKNRCSRKAVADRGLISEA